MTILGTEKEFRWKNLSRREAVYKVRANSIGSERTSIAKNDAFLLLHTIVKGHRFIDPDEEEFCFKCSNKD